jgi:hypothetical protein
MTTMIALVGAQPLPNFLPVRHYHPDSILLVYTTTTKQPYERQKIVLQKEVKVYEIETDPYDIPTIMKDIHKKLDEITEPTSQPPALLFNLTGGTKTMSLAAYQVAQQRSAPMMYMESEGKRSRLYNYIWQDERPIFTNSKEEPEYIPECVKLRDVLNIHLGEEHSMWEVKGPTVDNEGAGHLFELAVAQALCNHGYEVMCGVKDIKNQIDIDVMIRYQNQIAIIETKTGKHANGLEGVKQLSTAVRYLGGTYTKQFLVTNHKSPADQQTTCDLLKINVVSLLHYQKSMTVLTQEDITTLLTAIDNNMRN